MGIPQSSYVNHLSYVTMRSVFGENRYTFTVGMRTCVGTCVDDHTLLLTSCTDQRADTLGLHASQLSGTVMSLLVDDQCL